MPTAVRLADTEKKRIKLVRPRGENGVIKVVGIPEEKRDAIEARLAAVFGIPYVERRKPGRPKKEVDSAASKRAQSNTKSVSTSRSNARYGVLIVRRGEIPADVKRPRGRPRKVA